MGVASLTFFDFATLPFHFAIFTIVFVIDQINEASPWWRRAEPLLSGWRHIHSWKNQPILMLSIITSLYCQFHPIRRNFTIGVVKYSYFELFDWQFSSTWDGPSQMTKQATRDICLLSTWLVWNSEFQCLHCDPCDSSMNNNTGPCRRSRGCMITEYAWMNFSCSHWLYGNLPHQTDTSSANYFLSLDLWQ